MNIVNIKNYSGQIYINYDEKTVGYMYLSKARQRVEIPFSDITGIELSKKKLFSSGKSCLIIKGKRILDPDMAEFGMEITMVEMTSSDTQQEHYDEFSRLAKKLNVPIKEYKEFTCPEEIHKGQYIPDGCEIAESIKERHKEYRSRCNVCGKIFCYTEADLAKNKSNTLVATVSSLSALGSVAGGSMYSAYESNKMADKAMNKVINYDRCPSCNSTNITRLTDKEWEAFQDNSSQITKTQNEFSVADELKKFKELLDIGIITQEEFDAKKKQLLGL